MEVTKPRLLDAEGRGSTFPRSLYLLATRVYHPTRLPSSSTLLSEPENSYSPSIVSIYIMRKAKIKT